MRRLLLSALTVPVLALTACSDDSDEATATTPEPATDDTEATTSTSVSDGASSTVTPGASTGDDGQAAADRTEEFMVALVGADPEFCRLLVGLDGDAPMADSPDELALCEQSVIPQLEGQVSEEEAAVVEVIEIDRPTVEGDTARVTAENFGGIFAEGFSDADIVLQRFDGQWYVDLQRSDLGSTSP